MSTLALPPDHDERLRVARRGAQWELGDPSWADVILAAYMNPDKATEDLDALEADPA